MVPAEIGGRRPCPVLFENLEDPLLRVSKMGYRAPPRIGISTRVQHLEWSSSWRGVTFFESCLRQLRSLGASRTHGMRHESAERLHDLLARVMRGHSACAPCALVPTERLASRNPSGQKAFSPR
jgi:hypothetical protein